MGGEGKRKGKKKKEGNLGGGGGDGGGMGASSASWSWTASQEPAASKRGEENDNSLDVKCSPPRPVPSLQLILANA